MYAMVGRVEIKPGHEDETAMMAREHVPTLVGGMPGNKTAYWARAVDDRGKLIQHSFWLFETEQDARAAEIASTHCGRCDRRQRSSSVPTSAKSSPRCRGASAAPALRNVAGIEDVGR